jgi:hypothetical protein
MVIEMVIETKGDRHATLRLEREEHGFTRCRAERPLRREVPAGMKSSHRTARGRGVIVNAQMCR